MHLSIRPELLLPAVAILPRARHPRRESRPNRRPSDYTNILDDGGPDDSNADRLGPLALPRWNDVLRNKYSFSIDPIVVAGGLKLRR